MENCGDKNCPFHGNLSTRGRVLTGLVIKAKAPKTVIVQRDYLTKVPKYERYKRSRSKIPAHLPPCMKVKVGDTVTIAETRQVSKTKNFVVIKVESSGE